MTRFYELLEKAFDYQSAAIVAYPEYCASRSQLESWDFERLAAERDLILAREAKLDAAGMEWINLIRFVRAITFFGRGFGEIIRPLGVYSRWNRVPSGKSYLVICQEDLEEIVASWCGSAVKSNDADRSDNLAYH